VSNKERKQTVKSKRLVVLFFIERIKIKGRIGAPRAHLFYLFLLNIIQTIDVKRYCVCYYIDDM